MRDRALESMGCRVVRIWNSEVMENVEEVLAVIAAACRRKL